MPAYYAVELTPESSAKLLARVQPGHIRLFAQHITLALASEYKKAQTGEIFEALLGSPVALKATGHALDGQGQAVTVDLPAEIAALVGGGRVPHVTISCADGVKPSYSKELLAAKGAMALEPLDLSGVIVAIK